MKRGHVESLPECINERPLDEMCLFLLPQSGMSPRRAQDSPSPRRAKTRPHKISNLLNGTWHVSRSVIRFNLHGKEKRDFIG